MARKGLSQSVQSIERFVAQRPAFCLGAALSVGIALGWWVKTTMNRRNGSTLSPPNGVAKGMGELTHDNRVARRASVRAVPNRLPRRPQTNADPMALLLFAGIVTLGMVPICADTRCGNPSANRRPITGGGLFDRCDERLHRGGGDWSCGMVLPPWSRTRV